MPRSVYAIGQREITITRSAIRSVVKDLLKKWVFPSDAQLIFNELQGAQKFKNGKLSPCQSNIDADYGDYVFIDYEERYVQDGFNHDTRLKDNHALLYNDKNIGAYAKPHYAGMKVELSLRFRSRNLTTLTAFRNGLKFTSTERHVVQTHDIWYDYNVPEQLLYLADLMHSLKENNHGYDISLSDYISEYFKKGLTKRYNANQTVGVPIFEECQTDISGFLREASSFASLEISDGLYEITVPYEFYYRQPVAVETVFPLFVHNQFVGKKNIKYFDPKRNVSTKKKGWNPMDYLNVRRSDLDRYYKADGGTRMVDIDDFYPNEPLPQTQTITLFPIQVNETDPNFVVNLMEVPDELLPQSVKWYLKEFADKKGIRHRSIINIEVIETYDVERSLEFTLDDDLNVRSRATLDPRFRNYVRVSIFKDWALLTNKDMKDLLNAPESAYELAKLLDGGLGYYEASKAESGKKKDCLVNKNGSITVESMRDWLVSLPWVNQGFKKAPSGFMRTVMMSNITAKRRT